MKKEFGEIPPQWKWQLGCLFGFLLIAALLFLVYLAEGWVDKHF